jgi:hypothetical protein
MMSMTLAELREQEYEIRRSDLTSLSSLTAIGSHGTIELIETIQADDPEVDPERQAAREEARATFGELAS